MSVMELSETLAAGRAAQELRLKRGEFELATQMGHVRTVGGALSGRRRVPRGEVERLRRAAGFRRAARAGADGGHGRGAELMDISPGRFTRLARAGYLVPVRVYLNRYRAVVWLYLAEELRAFASSEPGLLTGRLPRSGKRTGPRKRIGGRARSGCGSDTDAVLDAEAAEAAGAMAAGRRTVVRATGVVAVSVFCCTRATTGGSARRSSVPCSIPSNWPSWYRIRTSARVSTGCARISRRVVPRRRRGARPWGGC